MKTIKFLSFAIFLIGFNLNAQDALTTYDNSYDGKSYEISVSFDDEGEFTLFIDAFAFDTSSETGGFRVTEKRYQGFINALNESSVKYEEWKETAITNNVTKLDKKMKISSKVSGYFFYGDEWRFQYSLNPSYNFKIMDVDDEINYLLIVRSGEMTASNNQFMDVDGFGLIFNSSNEIQEFIHLISLQKIKELQSKPKDEDLFKD